MSDFLGAWQAWHTAREDRLRDPHGWLGITAIHWLTPTPQRFVDVPGEWYGHERGAAVTLRRGEILTIGANVLGEGVHVLATCPVPPDANTLPFAVEAGEQLPAMASP